MIKILNSHGKRSKLSLRADRRVSYFAQFVITGNHLSSQKMTLCCYACIKCINTSGCCVK